MHKQQYFVADMITFIYIETRAGQKTRKRKTVRTRKGYIIGNALARAHSGGGRKRRVILFHFFPPRRRRASAVGVCVRASDWGVETRWRRRQPGQMRRESRGD